MEKKEKVERQEVGTVMKICRVIGIVMVIAACGYFLWRGDFDNRGIVGRLDDCFIVMAAYMFARGSFTRPERRYVRRQLYMFSSVFAVLALCWIIMLAMMK